MKSAQFLAGADLSGANLTGSDLRGAILRGADLRGVVDDENTKWPVGYGRGGVEE